MLREFTLLVDGDDPGQEARIPELRLARMLGWVALSSHPNQTSTRCPSTWDRENACHPGSRIRLCGVWESHGDEMLTAHAHMVAGGAADRTVPPDLDVGSPRVGQLWASELKIRGS